MSSRKQLVVNADDFGFTPGVNQGIVEAHRSGILTATTLMANGDAFDDAVRLAQQTPSLDMGCHLVLVGGRSLVTGRPFPPTVGRLLAALARRQIAVFDELAQQVRRIVAAGLRPTHLDTHKHAHLAPPVLDAVARLSEEFQIPWVRSPFDFAMRAVKPAPLGTRLAGAAIATQRGRFRRVLAQHGCRTTDHFAGFQITGRFGTAELLEVLRQLPAGSTELMCHPGRCGADLRQAPTRLQESREAELAALMAPETRAELERGGIELVNYTSLSAC